jgi:hypothetical protein
MEAWSQRAVVRSGLRARVDRLYPNPAEPLAAFKRLPHDAGLSHAARRSAS